MSKQLKQPQGSPPQKGGPKKPSWICSKCGAKFQTNEELGVHITRKICQPKLRAAQKEEERQVKGGKQTQPAKEKKDSYMDDWWSPNVWNNLKQTWDKKDFRTTYYVVEEEPQKEKGKGEGAGEGQNEGSAVEAQKEGGDGEVSGEGGEGAGEVNNKEGEGAGKVGKEEEEEAV